MIFEPLWLAVLFGNEWGSGQTPTCLCRKSEPYLIVIYSLFDWQTRWSFCADFNGPGL